MSEPRKTLPAAVRRAVMVEAGHRCAVPTCRGTSVLEAHHIIEHSKGGPDTEDNLIVMCAVCHGRVTKGEIDTKSVRHYKANLRIVNARYGDFERRVMEMLVSRGANLIELPGGRDVDLWYLLRDGYLKKVHTGGMETTVGGIPAWESYGLTETGAAFLMDWANANAIEAEPVEGSPLADDRDYPGFAYEDEDDRGQATAK